MKHLFCRALVLLLLPLAGYAQQGKPRPDYTYQYHVPDTIPWTKSLTAGFSIWPLTKERVRVGYSWEQRHKQYWLYELAYINAVNSLWSHHDRFGLLEGAQLRGEYRFYNPLRRNAFFYFGPSLAYMYTQHLYKRVEGMECDEFGNCAYFRRINEPVVAHTGNVAFNFGWVLRASPVFHFNFYGGLGLQTTYFPGRKNYAYFGKMNTFKESEHFITEPRIRLGLNLHFALRQRN